MISLIPHIIEHSAEVYPDKEVFRFDDEGVTYAEFNTKMNQLAHTLASHGIKRGDRVGIYLHKSMESAVAVYGILQAGAAYVPLDPHMPVSRLKFILEDCEISHLISEKSKANNIAEAMPESGLDLVVGAGNIKDSVAVRSWNEVYAGPADQYESGAIDQDIAYIMYTSGSTGEPKGMVHTHASGLSYAKMAAEEYQLISADRLSNFPPLHFDQSTFDFFSGPLVGATTVIIPEEYMKFPASMSELIQDERLTVWYSVPFALISLALHGAIEEFDLSSLRWVLYGGEPFPPKHMRTLQLAWPNAEFSNVYGPAEVNQCTAYTIPLVAENDDTPIPIGQISPHCDGLIVDDDNSPVPDGEVGELLICTSAMMSGYWKRPDLNATCFYDKVGPGGIAKRYYRTGDLVRQAAGGEMEFLGRKDRQVKVRGFRIELDEIEAGLTAHRAIAEAAAYILGDGEEKFLEATVTYKNGHTVESQDLKKYMLGKVAKYAVPQSIRTIDTYPRTGSGKIDRRALQKMRKLESVAA